MSSKSPKQVVFKNIEILEFHYTMGDNPSVNSGAPVALDPKLVGRSVLDVNHYERARGKRKSRRKMVLNVSERAQILMGLGYTIDEIANATLEAERLRKERSMTNAGQKWDKVNEVSERFGRVLRKAFVLGNPSAPVNKVSVAAHTA